jgi:mono/diheme cytochrome c family protein/cytochrome bd-type quinol oxidase subunit 1
MSYPFWNIPIGYGPLMAQIAVFHVFVSHFAVGGGLYLVVHETLARRRGDQEFLDFLEGLTRFFVLATLVFGAITGVGIWFVIGLLNPQATEVLIRNFVWAWAIEWTMFAVEIAAAILYFYGWKRMEPRAHKILGWIYFGAAWGSLLVINGIITFMLTPGRWLETGAFWDGYLNPTFAPSLVLRTGVCVMLAGLYALMILSRRPPSAFKTRALRAASAWGLGGLAVAAPALYWYWHALPGAMRETLVTSMRIPMLALRVTAISAALLALVFVVFGLLLPRRTPFAVGLLAMALGFASFGGFEWFRESARKPYIIEGYMYGNGIAVTDVPRLRERGLARAITYPSGDLPLDTFNHACRHCHTLRAYNALGPRFDGLDPAFIAAIVQHTDALRGNMPPFAGNENDARRVAAYLGAHTDRRPLAEESGLSGKALGALVFEKRCGLCHDLGGPFRDILPSLAEMDADELGELLDSADEYADEMPPFTGTAAERAALIEYLDALEPPPSPETEAKTRKEDAS